jgi:hypothetical protein
MPRALRSPVASGSTHRAAKCFGSKRGRRAMGYARPHLPHLLRISGARKSLVTVTGEATRLPTTRSHKSILCLVRLDRCPLCPDSDQIPQRSEMTLCANNRHAALFKPPCRPIARWIRVAPDQRFCSLEIEDEFEFGRLLNGQLRGVRSL